MGVTTIPVDSRNPGQVFACLGLMELTQVLCGRSMGCFAAAGDEFQLEAEHSTSPAATAAAFLQTAEVEEVGGGDGMAKPIVFCSSQARITLDHWADATSRNSFKLYSGNRSAAQIARAMLLLLRSQPESNLAADPWNCVCPMGGSFNFDSRGAWTAMDTGFSPNRHQSGDGNVQASPAVEILAALGLQNARPATSPADRLRAGYAIWHETLPLSLARPALGGALPTVPCTRFSFRLRTSGKNKVVTYAHQED